MRIVLGVSLTATSAVWALVDTKDGAILADEIVAIDSVHEIAKAAARSIQAFALQSDRDIDGVRMTWTDDARTIGIRLRSKLRLFGFDVIETVTEEAAREGRNRTARHIAPHLALAYGAARAEPVASRNPLLHRLPVPVPIAAAASVAVICAVAITTVLAVLGGGGSEASQVAASEPVAVAPPLVVPAVPPPVPAPLRSPAPVREPQPAAQPATTPTATPQTEPDVAAEPAPLYDTLAPGEAVLPEEEVLPVDAVLPEVAQADPATPGLLPAETLPAATQPAATPTGQPHLSPATPLAGPAQPAAAPAPAAQAPVVVPPPPPNPLDILAALP